MDRNTLTALLLITVVLILTPHYMELISPQPQPKYETGDGFIEDDGDRSNDSAYNITPPPPKPH